MKNKVVDHLALARRIRAAGCHIHIEEDDGNGHPIPSDGLRIHQTGGVIESCAMEWGDGAAFIIQLVITINLPNFAISAFGLEPPWKKEYFYWLEDPLVIDGSSLFYRFGGRDSPEFERSQVLNHCADVQRTYSSGQSLKGFLLGFGFDPIPEQYRHGTTVPVFVIVYDQFGRDYRSPVVLWVDRSRARPRVQRKRSMLDHPDPIARG